MQIKVSDYIAKYLEDYGVRLVFMISGGGAMHLNDSFGASREIRYFCNHHEQASAFGAEGCARISFATSMANLTKAMERIQRVVAG